MNMNIEKRVSVIVVYKPYYQNFEKSIISVLNQTYSNIELVLVNESHDVSENFDKIARNYTVMHPNIKIYDESTDGTLVSEHLAAAASVNGDYVIILPFAEVLTKDYIASSVKAMQDAKADMSISKLSFYFPKETIADLYSYTMQDYSLKKNSPLYTFLSGASKFWGYYYLGNKVISKSLFNDIFNSLSGSKNNSCFGYGEDILFSYILWTTIKRYVITEEYSVLSWKNEDQLYSDVCQSAMTTAKSFLSVIAYILNLSANKIPAAEKDLLMEDLKAYCRRYIWRASWAYRNNALNSLKSDLTELLGFNDFEFTGEAKKIEDDNKYIDLSSKLNLTEHAGKKYTGKINIYVSMHKDSYVAENKYLIPIQVGTQLASEEIPGVLHDNTGINISEKNKRYCELTAQYWAWKNVKDADYYGFWHYRRYFSFNLNVEPDVWGNLHYPDLDSHTLKLLNISEESIERIIPQYDVVIPEAGTCDEGDGPITILEHWRRHFYVDDITVTMQVIAEKYPKFIKYFNQTLLDTKAVFCNMFIMKKALFEEYNEFCFGVLSEVEKRVDHSTYNVERYRTLGHIAERLVNVYIRYLKDTRPELKILSLPIVVFGNTKNSASLNKIKSNKKVYATIALACDDKYMPFTGALLQSIVENTNKENFYDIVIMHNSISAINQRIATNIAKGFDNISIRFLDISRNFAEYASVHVDRHLTVETYFRFMIPDLFKEYDKVLYMDCDMIANDDLAKLFTLDLGNNYIAATRDLDFIAACQEPGRGEFYSDNILKYIKIDSPENYFQAGVILFNIPEINKKYTTEKLFEVALSRNWYYHDQDVLNHLFNGKVKYLDQRWNTLSLLEENSHRFTLFRDYLYANYNSQYYEGRKKPAVIHYAGVPKPWKDLDCDLADYFWEYARNCPYYESLLLISNEAKSLPNGSLIFYNRNLPSDNVGAPLFTIKCNSNDWTSSYADIEFMYLTDNDKPCKTAKLSISARIVPMGGYSINKISRFSFDGTVDADFFRNNIGFVVNPDKSITVWAKYANIYEGYAWRVLLLESRDLEKPSIVTNNQGIEYDSIELPNSLRFAIN